MLKWFSCNESLFMLGDMESGEITANTDDDALKNGLTTKLCEYEFLSRKLSVAYNASVRIWLLFYVKVIYFLMNSESMESCNKRRVDHYCKTMCEDMLNKRLF